MTLRTRQSRYLLEEWLIAAQKKLRKVIASGQPLLFYWHESPTPAYEEALVIRRLKSKGILMGQRREIKVLIEKLNFD